MSVYTDDSGYAAGDPKHPDNAGASRGLSDLLRPRMLGPIENRDTDECGCKKCGCQDKPGA